MYKAYFGLKENPFNINTDPRYLYVTRNTEEALARLTYGLEARKGFILLTGEVGTGKTTLLNKLLESLHEQKVASAFVFNARLTESQFLDYMMADFGITCKSRMKSQVLFKLHQWLLERYQAGEQAVLVVDEAQNLSRQTLEEIRLLTNLETSTEKLLQIVLAGQPELEEKLNQRELRQLRQRIAVRAQTLPLTQEETTAYILERLRIAGANGEEIFSAAAIQAVHQHSRGIPRVVNLLSEHALLRAFLEQRKPVSAEVVEAVSRDFCLDESEILAQPVTKRPANLNGRNHKQNGKTRARRASRADNGAVPDDVNGQPPVEIAQRKLPLFIYGYWPDGTPFYEEAYTVATNVRGGLVSMRTPVQRGQRLLITNKENECSQECVVEFLGANLARGVDVAFEFAAETPEFWTATDADPDKPIDTETQAATPAAIGAGTEIDKNPAGQSQKACA
jgi:general secretion pathway protein A